jgi:hypothetical protein
MDMYDLNHKSFLNDLEEGQLKEIESCYLLNEIIEIESIEFNNSMNIKELEKCDVFIRFKYDYVSDCGKIKIDRGVKYPIEIKYDKKSNETNNFAIETHRAKRNAGKEAKIETGLLVSKSRFWLIYNDNVLYLLNKSLLKRDYENIPERTTGIKTDLYKKNYLRLLTIAKAKKYGINLLSNTPKNFIKTVVNDYKLKFKELPIINEHK